MIKTCKTCAYRDWCSEGTVCEYYAGEDSGVEDAAIERIVERGYYDYYKSYREYISEYEDDLFFV